MNISDISLPEVYKDSYDFRLFCRWFKLALSKVQYDTESLPDLYDPLRCPSQLLWMLADTMGFKYDDRLPTAFNRLVLMYFMSMIRNRGSHDGVTLAAETNLAQYNILKYGEENDILYDRLEDTSIPVNAVSVTPHTPEGFIEVVYFSKEKPIDACIEYVRPVGMYIFQLAGVRFDVRTKISIDARLTDATDNNMSLHSTRVGHYTRADYATMQKTAESSGTLSPVKGLPNYVSVSPIDPVKSINSTEGRVSMHHRNTEYSGDLKNVNAGYRALYSLQMSNNEHIVDALLDPIFGLGYHPTEDDVSTYEGPSPLPATDDAPKIYNLRYDKALDQGDADTEAIGTEEVTTADESREQTWPNVTPRVNPIMASVGDTISAVGGAIPLNSTNTEYTDVRATEPEGNELKIIYKSDVVDGELLPQSIPAGTLTLKKSITGDYTGTSSDTFTFYVRDKAENGGNYYDSSSVAHTTKTGITITYGTDVTLTLAVGNYDVWEDTPVPPENYTFDIDNSKTSTSVDVYDSTNTDVTLVNAYVGGTHWDYILPSTVIFDGDPSRVINTGITPFDSQHNGRSWEFTCMVLLVNSSAVNLNQSMLVCCNTSTTTATGNMYWTGGASDTNLTHSQMKVLDPGFGFGGSGVSSTSTIHCCMRGTTFRKRSTTGVQLKGAMDGNCNLNVINVMYDATNHKFTTTITYKYADDTEETTEPWDLSLMNGADPMTFTTSDTPIILGGCYTSSYTVGSYQRAVGTSDFFGSVTIPAQGFRFRYTS